MKTIYSLKEFREQVLEIASKVNETYVSVNVGMTSHGDVEFKSYIHNYHWATGKTMEESLSKLREEVMPSLLPDIDVEIEVEVSEPENDISMIN